MSKIKKIIIAALLLAASIVINRFLSVNTSILSIGFTFVPLMLSGKLLKVECIAPSFIPYVIFVSF